MGAQSAIIEVSMVVAAVATTLEEKRREEVQKMNYTEVKPIPFISIKGLARKSNRVGPSRHSRLSPSPSSASLLDGELITEELSGFKSLQISPEFSGPNSNPRSFPYSVKQQCWQKAEKIKGRDPARWRRDPLGNIVFRKLVSCPGCLCHDYDHIIPFSKHLDFINIFSAHLEDKHYKHLTLPAMLPQGRTIKLPLVNLNLVRLKGMHILQQLHLEELLLRTSSDNWCIVNDGTNDRNIVMGISGKPAELLEVCPVIQDKLPVIRRFTGGGTVVVDHGTIFVTFICNKDAFPDVQPYPKPIMTWTSLIYKKVFQGIGDFSLRENDYVFGNRKFGGNAQSITKNRWIHHTSFLWDYDVSNMTYLKLPKRAPEYRKARNHLDFICRLKDYLQRSEFITRTIDALDSHFSVKSMELDDIKSPPNVVFEPSSRLLGTQELEEAIIDFQPEKISIQYDHASNL